MTLKSCAAGMRNTILRNHHDVLITFACVSNEIFLRVKHSSTPRLVKEAETLLVLPGERFEWKVSAMSKSFAELWLTIYRVDPL